MTAAFSVYLDVVRFVAAFAVFLDHLCGNSFTQGLLNPRIGRYGNVAVMIFFVLSGYVIAFVTSTRERNAKAYSIARFSRLYSVVTVALLLTFVFDAVGMRANPHMYENPDVLPSAPSWAGYASSFAFVQQFWMFGRYGLSPGTNQPFWSLSFEATYYVVAGLAMFAPRRISYPLSLLLLGLAGVRIAILLPIWFLGYYLYKAGDRIRPGTALALFLFPVSAALIVFAPQLFPRNPDNYNLIQDYMTALAFSLNVIAARQLLDARIVIGRRLKAQARWLGGLTFPLYAIHFPALCLFAAISPWAHTSWAHVVFIASSVLVLVAVCTPICELFRRKLHQMLERSSSSVASLQ